MREDYERQTDERTPGRASLRPLCPTPRRARRAVTTDHRPMPLGIDAPRSVNADRFWKMAWSGGELPFVGVPLMHGMRFGKGPGAIENLGARAIEAHSVVPARLDRQAVGHLAVATAELDGNRAVGAFLCSDVVERIRVIGVFLKVPLGVVDADRPEAVDGHVLDVEAIDGSAVILSGGDVEIGRILVGDCRPRPQRFRSDAGLDRPAPLCRTPS